MKQKDEINRKRILVTGISGFIGGHLAATLTKRGAEVYGLSRHESRNKIITGDILDKGLLERIFYENKIQQVIHLASESLVESGQIDPYQTFTGNIQGTLNILEVARKYAAEKVIIASTSHVYGRNKVPYYEGYTPRPSRPYETSKACIDLIAQSYATTFDLPVLIPRFVNVYGPGDMNFTRLIPKTIRAVLHDEPPEVWGGDALRDYLYISDAVAAYMALLEIPAADIGKQHIFNFGTGMVITVSDLVEKIIKISNKDLAIKRIKIQRQDEIRSQYVSWKKARTILSWEPKVSLDEGLMKSIAWYKKQIISS
jgi:CDP-glucose 4,6-dehydratase